MFLTIHLSFNGTPLVIEVFSSSQQLLASNVYLSILCYVLCKLMILFLNNTLILLTLDDEQTRGNALIANLYNPGVLSPNLICHYTNINKI